MIPHDTFTSYAAHYRCGHARTFEIPNAADVPNLQALARDRDCPDCEVHQYVRRMALEHEDLVQDHPLACCPNCGAWDLTPSPWPGLVNCEVCGWSGAIEETAG